MGEPPNPRATVDFIDTIRSRSKTLSYSLRLVPLTFRGRALHYYYLNGGSTSLFYLHDICELIKDVADKKELTMERMAKSLDMAQVENVQSPITLSNGSSPPTLGKGFLFVTADAVIKLIAVHCTAEIQRECLVLLLKFVEESFSKSLGLSTSSDSLPSSPSSSASDLFDSSKDNRELLKAFRAGVVIKDRKKGFKTYVQCFVGSEAVDWLVANHWANTRAEAENLGQRLQQRGAIASVGGEHKFRDKSHLYKLLELPKEIPQLNERIKLLILGPHKSGKTTLFNLLPKTKLEKEKEKDKDRTKSSAFSIDEVVVRQGWKTPVQRIGGVATFPEFAPPPSPRGSSKKDPAPTASSVAAAASSTIPREKSESGVSEYEENLVFTLWDFNGSVGDSDPTFAPAYRGPHQFFFSNSRTINLIVINLLDVNAWELDYWMGSCAKFAPKTPVVVVGTHADELNPPKIAGEIEEWIYKRYKKSNMVKAFVTVSNGSFKTIQKLKSALATIATADCIQKDLTLQQRLEESDVLGKVEQVIAKELRRSRAIVPSAELLGWVKSLPEVNSPAKAARVLELARSVGLTLPFDKDFCAALPLCAPEHTRVIPEWVVINPNWLVRLVARLKAHSVQNKSKGLLLLDDIKSVWKAAEVDQVFHDDLIDLMAHYNLAHVVTRNATAPSGVLLALPSIFPLLPRPTVSSKDESMSANSLADIFRYFVFSRAPEKLIERLAIQTYLGTVLNSDAQDFLGTSQFDWYGNGMCLTVWGKYTTKLEIRVLLGPSQESALILKCSGIDQMRAFRFISDLFSHTLEGEFNQARYSTLVPCSCGVCSDKPYQLHHRPFEQSLKKDSVFPVNDLEVAFARGQSTLNCRITHATITIDSMAPDVAMTDMTNLQISYEELVKEKLVATGAFGKVWRAQLRGDTVAFKEIIVPDENQLGNCFREFRRETWINSLVSNHPNLVQTKGFSIQSVGSGHFYADKNEAPCFALVMEFIPFGNLYSFLHTSSFVLDWRAKLKIALDLAEALKFLHSIHILHHDVKSLNCFMTAKTSDAKHMIKLGDFGEARMSFSYTKRDNISNPIWLAPEVMKGAGMFTKEADVYSVGIILYEIACREPPFQEYPEGQSKFVYQLEEAIINGLRPNIRKYTATSKDPIPAASSTEKRVPMAYADLVEECWVADPAKRPTIAQVTAKLRQINSQLT